MSSGVSRKMLSFFRLLIKAMGLALVFFGSAFLYMLWDTKITALPVFSPVLAILLVLMIVGGVLVILF